MVVAAYWISVVGVLPPLSLALAIIAWWQIEAGHGTRKDRELAEASVSFSLLGILGLVILWVCWDWVWGLWKMLHGLEKLSQHVSGVLAPILSRLAALEFLSCIVLIHSGAASG